MSWVRRQADVHKCALPTWRASEAVTTGDIWECPKCGAQHQVKVESDQREPGCWFTWTLFKEATREA